MQGGTVPFSQEAIKYVLKHQRPFVLSRASHPVIATTSYHSLFIPPLICSPLIFQNKSLGVITISGRQNNRDFNEDELVIFSHISAQVALALENARLDSNNQKTYLETITALALAVEARDVYSRGHADRVAGYSAKIAQVMGLRPDRVKAIKEAAELHDVGKIGISDEILRKPAMLNELERDIMQQHPVIGEGIIVPLHDFAHLRDPIRHHHEWLNGEGYPDHLQGDRISLEARILAVADSLDAMATDRPYRKGMSLAQA